MFTNLSINVMNYKFKMKKGLYKMKKSKTRVLRKAVEDDKRFAEDATITMFLDSFNENIIDALNVEFERAEFELEANQSFFMSKNLDKEKISNFLIEKGVKEENVKYISSWSGLPISIREIHSDFVVELFVDQLCKDLKTVGFSQEKINFLIYLYSCLAKDTLKNSIENIKDLTLQEIPDTFTDSISLIEEKKDFCDSISSDEFETFFNLFNQITKLFYVDNKMEDDVYYLMNIENDVELKALFYYIRRFQSFTTLDVLNKPSKLKRTSAYFDFKDDLMVSFGIFAAAERNSIRLNAFLNNDAYEKGYYEDDEMRSLRANTCLIYGRKQTKLKELLQDSKDESEDYPDLKESLLEKFVSFFKKS